MANLPSGYIELEYIESTGTQYIDTGYKPNNNTQVITKAFLSLSDKAYWLFGARNGSAIATFGFLTYQNQYRSDYGTNQGQFINQSFSENFIINKNKNITTINDSNEVTSPTNTFQCSYNLYLFANNSGGSITGKGSSTIYYFQIFENGNKIRDFIPCKNPSNEVGLYDLVSKQFFGNAGTGTFTAGPVIAIAVAVSEVTELEYIRSSNTQYISSAINPNQDTRMDLRVSSTQTGSHTIAGTDVSWTGNGFAIGVGFAHFGTETANISGMNDGNTHDISLNKNVLSVDGEVKHTFSSQTFSISYSLALFANNRAESIQEITEMNLHSCQIYDDGTLIRDYIPAMLSDGTLGLYDKLHGLLYINAGSGAFTAGPEVPQNEITITGVPSNLGELAGNSSFNYIVSDTLGSSNISVTEKIDSSVLRTYLVNSGDNQTFTIDISTLDSGAHTYTVEASISDITSSAFGNFSIADNVITIEGLPTILTNVKRNFELKYAIYDTAGSETFTVTNSVDNQVISSFVTTTSKTNVINIDISNLNEGYHTFYVQAVASVGSITKSVEFYVNKDVQGYISKSVRQLRAKINILNYQMQTVDEISGNVLDGNITEDANSDIRRTCNISMVVTNGQFNVQPGGQIWLKIRPSKMY